MLADLLCLGIALLPMVALLFWSAAPTGKDFKGEL